MGGRYRGTVRLCEGVRRGCSRRTSSQNRRFYEVAYDRVELHGKSRIASESGQFSGCLCRDDVKLRRHVSTFKRCMQIPPKSKAQFGWCCIGRQYEPTYRLPAGLIGTLLPKRPIAAATSGLSVCCCLHSSINRSTTRICARVSRSLTYMQSNATGQLFRYQKKVVGFGELLRGHKMRE